MTVCRGAVPVWIMPMSRVVESFDPRTVRFDVVIIDEASQSDVMGLLALYYADTAIVVGDNEQVSPSAVGQELTTVQHLIDEHLQGVPNGHLYDGKTSIYDLASASFGATIRLVEHFRCVPEIIQFSNQLCYDWTIRPLRDGSTVRLKPHVVAHRVVDAIANDKTNEEEAREVAALVLSACEQPEYAKKTFGIVSMVGEQQAYRIEALLRRHLREDEFKLEHNILCGNAAHFQGDQRDVMFLSMVDTSDCGVLKMRQEPTFKQRFNVAASRAKDQMWVVHSLDPRSHLKAGDLRRRLIEHAEDPDALIESIQSVESKTELPFEKEVASRLVQAGYRVSPQWRVGYYRIDLVVEHDARRVAIECDGDKYHPIEKLPDDMARQAVLERRGWKFIRIRGSAFFRDPEGVMRSVFAQISSLGIEPVGPEPSAGEQSPQGELVERVIRRAKEIRREWRDSDNETNFQIISSGNKRRSRQSVATSPEPESLTA
jgi:very-short-patch-repair endonuclease